MNVKALSCHAVSRHGTLESGAGIRQCSDAIGDQCGELGDNVTPPPGCERNDLIADAVERENKLRQFWFILKRLPLSFS